MKWTNIKDKMPPENEIDIIVYVSDYGGEFHEAVYNNGEFYEPYYGQTFSSTFKNVTHWMIPEKPEGL